MSIFFNAAEILEMAIQIERNGAKFYRTAGANAIEPPIKSMFDELAAMEVQHQATFSAMLKEVTAKGTATTFDLEEQGALYLRAMVEGKVFDTKSDPSSKLTGKESLDQILNIAIGLEKESIVFYVGIKEMVREESDKEQIDHIIREEMGHISTLADVLVSVKKG
jgi:rubrerythrin